MYRGAFGGHYIRVAKRKVYINKKSAYTGKARAKIPKARAPPKPHRAYVSPPAGTPKKLLQQLLDETPKVPPASLNADQKEEYQEALKHAKRRKWKKFVYVFSDMKKIEWPSDIPYRAADTQPLNSHSLRKLTGHSAPKNYPYGSAIISFWRGGHKKKTRVTLRIDDKLGRRQHTGSVVIPDAKANNLLRHLIKNHGILDWQWGSDVGLKWVN